MCYCYVSIASLELRGDTHFILTIHAHKISASPLFVHDFISRMPLYFFLFRCISHVTTCFHGFMLPIMVLEGCFQVPRYLSLHLFLITFRSKVLQDFLYHIQLLKQRKKKGGQIIYSH